MRPPRAVSYVVGQWVRGDCFYGRGGLIREILDGPRSSVWVLARRRVGKTSLLKQLEVLTARPDSGYLPAFWDFQGADDPAELAATFHDALLDAEERFAAVGVTVADVPDDDLFAAIATVRRRLRARGLILLLLCDEVEELVNLHRSDATLLRKLRRSMQSQDGVRSVLASSVRLFALAEQRDDTSPFLHGFTPPLVMDGLTDDEARSLIRQDQLAEQARPVFDPDEIETIRTRCHNHPYLIQLVCKRFLEIGDLEEACERVASDATVSHFFEVDFDLLSGLEQTVLRALAARGPIASGDLKEVLRDQPASGALHRLADLGFIRQRNDDRLEVAGFFLRRWMAAIPASRSPDDVVPASAPTLGLDVLDGRYILVERVGEGATGTVYKAKDTLLDAPVAVKLLRPEYTADAEALDRVRQEIVLSRDIGHSNILRTYHLGSCEGGTYLTMQWIGARTLADVLADHTPLPLDVALTIAAKLASALAAAHGRKILHRDIKPSNILLADDGEPYLADFGLARLIGGAATTRYGQFVGTPHYASPEQAALGELDERSDIYALGLVLFEMVTGRRPFAAESVAELLAQQRSAPPPDPRDLNPEVPPVLAALILRCLAKDPAARFSSADALRAELLAMSRAGDGSSHQKL
ncbi:MAG: serine/threonine-protein kinase [Deinococcales bacterium]